MVCKIFYASHPGSREENQDNYLIPGMRIKKLKHSLQSGKRKLNLNPGKKVELALSDGMGGEENGAVASKTVLKALKKYSETGSRAYKINEAVLSVQDTNGNCGATLVCADFRSDGKSMVAYIEAAGDSPCFLIRDRKVTKITRDDNLYQQLIEDNNLPDNVEDIAKAKAGLVEYFGKPGFVNTQLYRMFVEPGDVVVLSSDGVPLDENDYPFFMENSINPAEELVSTSVRENMEYYGCSDNATAIIIEFEGDILNEKF